MVQLKLYLLQEIFPPFSQAEFLFSEQLSVCTLTITLSPSLPWNTDSYVLISLILFSTAQVALVVSDSLWAHGLQPARLLWPWDFPSKNTGVGCNFLLQGIFLTQGSNLCLLKFLFCTIQSISLPEPILTEAGSTNVVLMCHLIGPNMNVACQLQDSFPSFRILSLLFSLVYQCALVLINWFLYISFWDHFCPTVSPSP